MKMILNFLNSLTFVALYRNWKQFEFVSDVGSNKYIWTFSLKPNIARFLFDLNNFNTDETNLNNYEKLWVTNIENLQRSTLKENHQTAY